MLHLQHPSQILGIVMIFLLLVEWVVRTFFKIYSREACSRCVERFGKTQTTGIWVTHKKKYSTGENKFKENVKVYALLFVFQSQRVKCHCGGKKNVLLFPSSICYKK